MVEYFNILENFPKSIPYAFFGLIFIIFGGSQILGKVRNQKKQSKTQSGISKYLDGFCSSFYYSYIVFYLERVLQVKKYYVK